MTPNRYKFASLVSNTVTDIKLMFPINSIKYPYNVNGISLCQTSSKLLRGLILSQYKIEVYGNWVNYGRGHCTLLYLVPYCTLKAYIFYVLNWQGVGLLEVTSVSFMGTTLLRNNIVYVSYESSLGHTSLC